MKHRIVVGLAAALLAACGSRAALSPAPSPSATGTTSPIATATASASPAATAQATAAATASAVSATIVPAARPPTGAPTATPRITVAPTPSPTVAPPTPGALSLAQLKYRLVDRFGRLWYCDPDHFPVARADEGELAEQRFPEIQRDTPTFEAILAHLGYPRTATYTKEQKLAIYRDWKMLGALRLDPAGPAHRFNARFTPDDRTGSLVEGTIDPGGRIAVTSQTASGQPPCPICLARGTLIATPDGPRAVETLRPGMFVWTTDAEGSRVAGVIVGVGSTTAPDDHEVVRLVLSDGRELRASPGHPLADGRLLGALVAGDAVGGAIVLSAARVAYGAGETFDLLPSGATGAYWADGVPLGSTIASRDGATLASEE